MHTSIHMEGVTSMEDFVLSQKMWFVQHSNIPPQKILNVPIYYEGFFFFDEKLQFYFLQIKHFPFYTI